MASVEDAQLAAGAEDRPRRFDRAAEDRTRLQRIELARDARGRDDVLCFVDEQLRDEACDARDLLALLDQKIREIVVELHRLQRLDEERRAGAGALVQDS